MSTAGDYARFCQMLMNRGELNGVRLLSPKTLAVMTDLHLGSFVGIDFVRRSVELANDLRPDLIALVGDFVHRGSQTEVTLPACLQA